MPTINPYINFNGNAQEAFTFYQSIFGGAFTNIIRFKDMAPSTKTRRRKINAHRIAYR